MRALTQIVRAALGRRVQAVEPTEGALYDTLDGRPPSEDAEASADVEDGENASGDTGAGEGRDQVKLREEWWGRKRSREGSSIVESEGSRRRAGSCRGRFWVRHDFWTCKPPSKDCRS